MTTKQILQAAKTDPAILLVALATALEARRVHEQANRVHRQLLGDYERAALRRYPPVKFLDCPKVGVFATEYDVRARGLKGGGR